MYDLTIIGGGPAAMTAAIYAARKMLNAVVVTKDQGGQLLLTREIENWPGTISISGFDLVQSFVKHVERYGVEQRVGRPVTAVRRDGEDFVVEIEGGDSVSAKAVLIATGGRSRPLNVPGEKEFTGRGVSYCATCDAPLFSGKPVAVIGGGNSAFEAVIDLLPIATEIHVVDVADHWFADPILQGQVLGVDKVHTYQQHKVVEVKGDKFVNGLVIEDMKTGEKKELRVDGVFIEIGLIPNSDFLTGFVEINKRGEVVVDEEMRTSVPGVFAAGDVINRTDKQVVIAAGQGAKAALSAYRYLVEGNRLEDRGNIAPPPPPPEEKKSGLFIPPRKE
ncbi:MAG TPA: thioredoxin-disulfide reductase [Candidatus Acetothermia bacterium]|nr:FAD-dependent oxidoreductase [Candidatus Bipolaricaulota bacterium]HDJ30154.1 thioredoxin-disulfide reductase [Candidatus Acetothermia bacterium]